MSSVLLPMTDKQKQALEAVHKRWFKVLNIEKAPGSDDAIMVHVQGKSGATMWLGIEEDGYTHS